MEDGGTLTPNDLKFEQALPLLENTQRSVRSIATEIGMDARSLRRHIEKKAPHLKRAPLGTDGERETPGVTTHEDGSRTVVTSEIANLPTAPWKPVEMLTAHGLDPDAWVIVRVRVNRWGTVNEPSHQLRFDVVPKTALIVPPSVDPEWGADVPEGRFPDYASGQIAIVGDHHAPHHDPLLHKAFLQYLRNETPELGVILGDLLDFSNISRHRQRDGYAQSVNETLQAGYEILRSYREASPDTKWTMLRGNHDDRLEHQILDNVSELHGIRAAGEEISALALRRLLRLDELAITLVDQDWDRGKFAVTDSLTARHGYMTSPTTGTKMLQKHSNSQIQGHTHRMRFTYQTKHDPVDIRVAIEAGTMAKIEDSLGYGIDEDWQQGFVVGYIWDDGDFSLAPAIWVNNRLLTPWGARYLPED